MDSKESKRILVEGGYDIGDDSRSIEKIAEEILVREALGEEYDLLLEDQEAFSAFVRRVATNLGLTDRNLSDISGATGDTVRRYREGKVAPQDPVRKRVINKLGSLELQGFNESGTV